MPKINLRQASKVDWATADQKGEYPGDTNIQLGCLMRIADATEKMAKKYTDMEANLEWYKKKYAEHRQELDRMAKRIAGYQGYINRLKKAKKK